MKRILLFFTLTLTAMICAVAAPAKHAHWSWSVDATSATEGNIVVTVDIDEGWHIYGFTSPESTTVVTNITVKAPGLDLAPEWTPSVQPEMYHDTTSDLDLPVWEGKVTFTRAYKVTDSAAGHRITGEIDFMTCNDVTCLAPENKEFELTIGDVNAIVDTPAEETASAPAATGNAIGSGANNWWTESTFSAPDAAQDVSDTPIWMIFILGFVGGLVALLTPCVWPMIPMTVSFFLKKSKDKKKSLRDAVTYGLSIIVIYLALGIIVTLAFGADALNSLATNAIFNIIFFLLLVVFAVSFFGAFDIKLPSKWSNAMDERAESTTGLLSIFFMAFTLVLVSFSCTGPIIGTLLVEAATSGELLSPIIGMFGFALALALPFTLFAIFPSMLNNVGKSGGWMNSIKVVLGFLELALSLKFLSVADMAYGWHILDREVFLVLWIAIFASLTMYLLGKLRFPHDEPVEKIGVFRYFLALISMAFTIYLVPGLWGAPLKTTSAFVPPLTTQDFNLYHEASLEFDDYDEGMAYAAEHNLPVVVDFSGWGCVNCRKMEAAVFDTERIQSLMRDNFVFIKLMVDEKASLPEPITVEEGGETTKLKTVGNKWSYLQRMKFAANSQPYYVILDNNGDPLVDSPRAYDENIDAFEEWLKSGLANYEKQKVAK